LRVSAGQRSVGGAQGFQRPEIIIEAILQDGDSRRFTFDPTFANPLPRPLSAHEVRFKVNPGVRFYIDVVDFSGLTVMRPNRPDGFSVSTVITMMSATVNFSPLPMMYTPAWRSI
jgi:hypothetical protein